MLYKSCIQRILYIVVLHIVVVYTYIYTLFIRKLSRIKYNIDLNI